MTGTLIGTPIDEVIESFKTVEKQYRYHPFNEVRVKDDNVKFVRNNRIVHTGKVTSAYWLKYFCDTANIPYEYIQTLDTDMMVELVNYHHPLIEQEQYTRKGGITLAEDQSKNDFALVSNLREYAKGSDLLTTYKGYFEGQTNVVHYLPSVESPSFSILNEKWDMAFLNKNDIQYFGLTMRWLNRSRAPFVYGSSHRPTCGNLMHVPENIGRVNTKFTEMSRFIVLDRFAKAGRKAVNYVKNTLIPGLTMTTEKTFSDLVGFLNTIPMTQNTRDLILKAYLNENGNTVYHVIQACTYAATHYTLEQDEIDALNNVVSFLLGKMENHTCSKCHQPVV